MTTHQTHENGPKGQTDSAHKLSRLKMPDDLTGKAVLDIGCNEGFFCNQALKRNANRVIGIDMDEEFLRRAKEFYVDPRVTYLHQGWNKLPEGSFDLILWTSAMHYELDPQSVLVSIASKLTLGGTFILECGVKEVPRKEMVYSLRHDGGNWYPTLPLIEEMLGKAGFSYRMVSHAELVGTDPIPRVVFHCKRRIPSVIIVSGQTQVGKSDLAGLLYPAAKKVISLDHFISRIAVSECVHTPLEKFIKESTDPNSLGPTYDGIDANGLTEAYISLLSKGVAESDDLVVIEGYMTEKQIQLLEAKLSNKAFVWVARKSISSTGLLPTAKSLAIQSKLNEEATQAVKGSEGDCSNEVEQLRKELRHAKRYPWKYLKSAIQQRRK
ncbi:bifunctional 2-polyprenyl-6-hydroxyphenol methylase/3-demethylubiquinol 3-O-methyltransferase UbiG [Ruegeria sp. HKCCA6837]|uniref:class I SAM-dependent methyltransferase n=1 Tax=Ruegeria sp. HKCCA6837 TaxID=2682989 RepID=UPI0014889411|nr:class I SAM-dependent methyltransferase [Ruegeria sp. HKCCA6837]